MQQCFFNSFIICIRYFRGFALDGLHAFTVFSRSMLCCFLTRFISFFFAYFSLFYEVALVAIKTYANPPETPKPSYVMNQICRSPSSCLTTN
jgi:hypothetical protein